MTDEELKRLSLKPYGQWSEVEHLAFKKHVSKDQCSVIRRLEFTEDDCRETQVSLEEVAQYIMRLPHLPGDSPIEEIFSWEFRKVAGENVFIQSQIKIGRFRVDFLITNLVTGRKIAIECDGKHFHDLQADSTRDAEIISTGEIDRIYRITGKDIFWHIHDALHLLSQVEAWLFSARGTEILEMASVPDKNRHDFRAKNMLGFPNAIVRGYWADQSSEAEGEPDTEKIKAPPPPTYILWT